MRTRLGIGRHIVGTNIQGEQALLYVLAPILRSLHGWKSNSQRDK